MEAQEGSWKKLGLDVLTWSGGVGIGMQLGYVAIRFLQGRVFARSEWYQQLTVEDQKKLAGRFTTILHHLTVAGGSLYSLLRNDPSVMHKVLLLETGFDVSDSITTVTGIGGMTGMGGVPILLHHGTLPRIFTSSDTSPASSLQCEGVAMALEIAYLKTYPLIPWRTAAAFCTILLGSGAVDLLMVKVIPRTPLYHSKYLWHATLAEFLVFLSCRVPLQLHSSPFKHQSIKT